MNQQTKFCRYCHSENFMDNIKCIHCGRYFPSDGKVLPNKNPGAGRPDPALNVEHLKLIPAIILLISLFLPWLAWFIVRLNAFDIANFFNLSARMAGRSTLSMGAVKILIYLIPVGCAVFIFRSLTGRTIKTTGIVTGILPLIVFLLVISQPTAILKMVSIGFILSILSGIALISISAKEE